MTCPRCGKKNDEDARFCARCGIEMATISEPAATGDELFCYRHPKVATRLSCGRCGKPVCTQCVKLGPAGPRCPDCARSNVAVRPGAVFYEIQRFVTGLFSGGGYMKWYILLMVLGLVGSLFRGCVVMTSRPALIQQESPGQQRQSDRTLSSDSKN